jgi:CRP-like cAMP-binding protein
VALNAQPSVQVSQEALAMMQGVTRQTLSKELKVLQALGTVSMRVRRIERVFAAKLDVLQNQ